MSIEGSSLHGFELICDSCGAYAEGGFDEFMDAVEAKTKLGWIAVRVAGEWQDLCPDCQKGSFE